MQMPLQNLAMASLVSIGTQLGSQFWVGTVAGPTMFCFLERPTFGFIQSKLFPKYGLIGTATSVIALGGHYFGQRGKMAHFSATEANARFWRVVCNDIDIWN